MSAESPALAHTFKVGRYRCTLTVPAIRPGVACSGVVEWDPDVPDRLTADELSTYRAEMLAAFVRLAGATLED